MKYKIVISGAAETNHCRAGALEKAKEIGREVIRQNGVLVTGATSGIPYWSAIGAKEEGGTVIGFSPAASEAAHIKTYRLPIDHHDVIIYTGFDYSGRNLLLTRSADAVVVICGRMGTLNEFSITFEDQKPIGILIGTGGTADMVKSIIKKTHRGPGKIVYNSNPKKLISELIKLVEKKRKLNNK